MVDYKEYKDNKSKYRVVKIIKYDFPKDATTIHFKSKKELLEFFTILFNEAENEWATKSGATMFDDGIKFIIPYSEKILLIYEYSKENV